MICSCYFFFLIAVGFQGTQHKILELGCMDLTVALYWAVAKFSYSLSGVCLLDVLSRVSNLFLSLTVYCFLIPLLVYDNLSYCEALTVFVLFLRRLWQIFTETIP